MLNLVLSGVTLWCVLTANIKAERLKYRLKQGTNGFTLEPLSMQNAKEVKYLKDIFEVSCPVGVFPVAPSAVPGYEPLFGSFLWSFGADQCASSEGFLVTFTPRGVEVIFCDYSFGSKDFFESFHFLKTLKGTPSAFAYSRSGGQAILDVSGLQAGEPDRLGAVGGNCKQRQEPPREYQDMISRSFPLYPWMRHNLMMTTPQGILVALNPTDEGRIGTGRNTLKSSDESNS